jgi:hypothetical protein
MKLQACISFGGRCEEALAEGGTVQTESAP